MAGAKKLTTTVSTKGQVILPSAIRQRREWRAGTRLTVEDTPEGVLLKPAPAFAETRPEDVFGVLAYKGKPKTLDEMVARALRVFAGLPTVTVEDGAMVAAALDLAERGLDFADALHLTRSGHCEGFVTFDRKLVKAAKAAGFEGVREA